MASSTARAVSTSGSWMKALKSTITGARASSCGAAAIFPSSSARMSARSRRRSLRVATPTWPTRRSQAASIIAAISAAPHALLLPLRVRQDAPGQPGQVRQAAAAVQPGLADPREAAHLARHHADAPFRHRQLGHLAEAHGCMEAQRGIVRRVQRDLATQYGHAYLGETHHVGVEHPAQAMAAELRGH